MPRRRPTCQLLPGVFALENEALQLSMPRRVDLFRVFSTTPNEFDRTRLTRHHGFWISSKPGARIEAKMALNGERFNQSTRQLKQGCRIGDCGTTGRKSRPPVPDEPECIYPSLYREKRREKGEGRAPPSSPRPRI